MAVQVKRSVESRDAILWDVDLSSHTCRVKIQGSDTLIKAVFPQNWNATPDWVKPGNAVRIIHKGGNHGYIEIAGHGMAVPSPPVGSEAAPTQIVPPNAIMSGLELLTTETSSMICLIKVGVVRIGGVEYSREAIAMDATNYYMDMGKWMDVIAGAITVNAAPSGTNFRIDIIVIGSDLVFDYIPGTPADDPIQPSTPVNHVLVGTILLSSTATYLTSAMFNRPYQARAATTLTTVRTPEDLDWLDNPSVITVCVKDQYGKEIHADGGGWYITMEFIEGNGTIATNEQGIRTTKVGMHTGTTATATFVYTRGNISADHCPRFYIEVAAVDLIDYTYITLYDSEDQPMWW